MPKTLALTARGTSQTLISPAPADDPLFAALAAIRFVTVKKSFYFAVKVRNNLLSSVKLVVFNSGLIVRHLATYPSITLKHLVLVELMKGFDGFCERFHGEGVPAFDQSLDVVKEAGHGALQLANLRNRQIVFCDSDVALEYAPVRGVVPSGEPHIRLCMVGIVKDNLSSSLTSYRIVELVLHHSVEVARDGRTSVIVNRALGKYVGNLLPNAPLARPNGADSLKKLAKVILPKRIPAFLKAVVIKGKTLDYVFL